MEKKTVDLRIRCKPSTARAFRVYVARGGFKNYEEALTYLLRSAGIDVGDYKLPRRYELK